MTDNFDDRPGSIVDELLSDLNREHKLVNVIIRGCIDHRWALGKEEKAIAQAMVFNAFEAYLIERGMTVNEAGDFCEQHIDTLMQSILAVL